MSESLSITVSPIICYTILTSISTYVGFSIWKEYKLIKLEYDKLLLTNDKMRAQSNKNNMNDIKLINEKIFNNPSARINRNIVNKTNILENYEN